MDAVPGAAHNAEVTTWHRLARFAGIALGGAGLLVAVWHAIAVPPDSGVLGGLSWLSVGVAPLFAVSVWVVCNRPGHPQALRLLLMGSALAVNVALEGPIQDAAREFGTGSWLWWPNLVYQYTGVLSLIAGVLLLASYPDGVVERVWQRRVLRATWCYLALPPLLLLSRPTLLFDAYVFDPAPVVASPFAVPWLEFLAGPLSSLYVYYYGALVVAALLFVRFLQADRAQRARMRLLVYVTAALIVTTALTVSVGAGYGSNPPVWLRLLTGLHIVLLLMVPVTIVIGIIRHRLFDIEPVMRRSAAFGLLSLLIAGTYLGLSAAPGLTFGREIPVELAVVLTIVAAVAFQPLRARLETARRPAGVRRAGEPLPAADRVRRPARADRRARRPAAPRLADTVHKGLAAPVGAGDAARGHAPSSASRPARRCCGCRWSAAARSSGTSTADRRRSAPTTAATTRRPRAARHTRRPGGHRDRQRAAHRAAWPSRSTSSPGPAPGSSRPRTSSAGGSSATSTTACSSTSSR